MNKYNMPLHIDEIDFVGRTREEKRLNKELLETVLELNSYQDSYDNMKTIEEVRVRIDTLKKLVSEEYIPIEDYNGYMGEIKALEWVLNDSKTNKEKLGSFITSREDVVKLLENLNKDYKQLSIYDCGVEDEKENKDN